MMGEMDNRANTCQQGVFSIGIVCYRNWCFLKEAIDSVLEQDYGQIQLIVSDDCSKGFPIQMFEEYIKANRKSNIIDFVVRQSAQNEGTVRHLNHVLDEAHGEYLMFMAADDKLAGSDVLSRYESTFEREGLNCGAVLSQTALYDRSMQHLEGYFVYSDVAEAINQNEYSDELLNYLYMFPVVPTTSICCRKWIFEKFGKFDTDYKLIEDYPLHIKLAENHVKLHYENFVGAKHRDGGISHGAVKALSASKRMYLEDCLKARKKVLNRVEKIENRNDLRSYNAWQIRSIQWALLTQGKGLWGKLKYAQRYPIDFFLILCRKVKKKYVYQSIALLCILTCLMHFRKNIAIKLAEYLPITDVAAFTMRFYGGLRMVSVLTLIVICCLCIMGIVKKIDRFPA